MDFGPEEPACFQMVKATYCSLGCLCHPACWMVVVCYSLRLLGAMCRWAEVHSAEEAAVGMVLITAKEEGDVLEKERAAIVRELQAIREMVAHLRETVEAGTVGTGAEAGKALSDLRTWLKHAKETEVHLARHRRETAKISGSYGLDLDAARDVVGCRLDRLRRCCREGGISDGA